MAQHKSAKKRIKTNEKRRIYNRAVKSRVKTFSRYFEDSLKEAGDKPETRENAIAKLKIAVGEIHKAARKGVFHKNRAARKVSALTLQFNRSFPS